MNELDSLKHEEILIKSSSPEFSQQATQPSTKYFSLLLTTSKTTEYSQPSPTNARQNNYETSKQTKITAAGAE